MRWSIRAAAAVVALTIAPAPAGSATASGPASTPAPALAFAATEIPAPPYFVSPDGTTRTHTTAPTATATAPASSTNWSGYAATGSAYTSVSATFTVPALRCSSGDQYSSFWVGLDGYSSTSVEQTGIEADCVGKSAQYYAWYELYPDFPVTYANAVKPGDVITASVVFSGSSTYTMTIKDAKRTTNATGAKATTRGWTKTTTKNSPGNPRSSAEVIAEAPYSAGVLPLADFGKVTFTGGTVDGNPLSSAGAAGIMMTGSAGRLQAEVGPLSGGDFTDTWKNG